jgi:hypothetical protein
MKHSTLLRMSPILLAAVAMLGCSDIVSLREDGPVGNYGAIILVMTDNGVPTNVLAGGGSLTMNLAPDGTTRGHLHTIGSAGTPGYPAVDADLAGTWTRNGDEVDFTQSSNTFVDDMTFRIEQITDTVWSLVSDEVVNGTRINVTLAHDR